MTELKAAAARVDLMPLHPVPLAGYGAGPLVEVATDLPLEGAVLSLQDANGGQAVIVCLDALFAGPIMVEAIEAAAEDAGRSILTLVFATHTHGAPALETEKPKLGAADSAHIDLIRRRVVSAVTSLLAQPHMPVGLRRADGILPSAINRRLPWPYPRLTPNGVTWSSWVMAPNTRRPVDQEATAILMCQDQTPVCVLWRWTCHANADSRRLGISADFPGIVRQALRQQFGKDLPILFLPGFCGDVRAPGGPASTHLRDRLRRVVQGPGFSKFGPNGYLEWSASIATVIAALVQRASPVLHETLAGASVEVPLFTILPNAPHGKIVSFKRLRAGAAFDIVGVAAEPLSRLQPLLNFDGALACGYLGDVFGYWPSEADIAEGGYEVCGFKPLFGIAGPFAQGSDDVFRRAADQLRRLEPCGVR